MPARQTVTFEDPVTNTEAFYKLVEVRPRVIKHKIKVRPQVEGYEVSVGGGYTAPCQPGPLQANYYDDYCNDILTSRRSRAHFLDDHAIDGGYSSLRHSGYYLGPRAVTGPVVKSTKVTKAITDYSVADDLVIPRPRLHAVGDSTINVSKRTIRTASPPPAPISTSTPTAHVLTPLIHSGFGRTHKTEKSSFSNQVDLIGKRANKVAAGSKGTLYNVSLADGLEFIRSMLTGGGSGFSLAEAIQLAKSADIDPYGRKVKYGTMGDGWVGPTENWREKVRKWEQEELSQLEEEQRKRKSAAFQEWEERMGEAEVMESGRADRIKQLQQEWAEAEVRFREEAMEAERARIARLDAKSIIIEEIDVDNEAKLIKEQKEKERKAALAKVEADRKVKEQQEEEERGKKAKEDAERKRLAQEAERKRIEEEKLEARRKEEEERKRIEEEQRKKKEEEERKKREEEEERLKKQKEEEERIKREEEERLRKEKEEQERIKREEEERLRKEEEERLRLEEEERRIEEEAMAKKFGLTGFGSFGGDPFAIDEDEEEEAASKEEEAAKAAEEGGSTGPSSLATAEKEVAATDEDRSKQSTSLVEPKEVDEGTELIVKDDEPLPEITIDSPPETIAEEEEPPEDSTTAHPKQESSWQESDVSSGATIEAEVNKDGTIVEEEETETIPGSSYTVTGGGAGDLPAIDIDEADGEDFSTSSSSSFKKTSTFSSGGGGGVEEEEEEESSSVTRRSTTTTVTEETETKRTIKQQKAAIDTHDHEIIIYNKDGVEITRVTHGDVIVGFDKVDEVVMVKNGLLTVSHDSGECLVKITDGEVNVFEFDGEVIVRSLLDVAHEYLVPKKSERKLSIHDIEREGEI